MHILMIAPEPFFEPRGTPFSEYHRIRALLELGHTVDSGDLSVRRRRRAARAARVSRPAAAARPPRGIGPSFAKVPLDLSLAATALRRALSERYDMVHSHEEGAAIGVVPRLVARGAAPLRHALEPAAATGQLQVQSVAPAAMESSSASSASRSRARAW
jgi:hypothetical protein